MNFILALLLQADDMGQQSKTHAPGSEGGFSRVMIVLFIVTLAALAGGAIWMVARGSAGVAKAEIEEEEKK